MLWDLFSGSAPYREVFLRTLHPVYIKDLVWNLVAGNARRADKAKDAVGGDEEGRLVAILELRVDRRLWPMRVLPTDGS